LEFNLLWISFLIFVVVAVYLDLFVFNKKSHIITYKEGLFWTIVWTILAFVFNGVIYIYMGPQRGIEFLTGYLIERALSFDNMFVFIMIFAYFNIPQLYQPRVLKWGIIGALIMRFVVILIGAELLNTFHWMIYIFGILLLYTGLKMLKNDEDASPVNLEENFLICNLKKCIHITKTLHDEKFLVRLNGKLCATPLLLVLIVIESSDLVFAIDSVPAVLAVTRDPFIVFSSNVFAIFGLRAMYFLLADLMNLFAYLKYGLSFILVFVGIKMLISEFYHIPIFFSLGFIIVVLTLSIVLSIYLKKEKEPSHNKV
jgi:tellurite resistance protein TerC